MKSKSPHPLSGNVKDCKDFPLKGLFGDLSTKKKDLKKRVDDTPEKKKKPDDFRILDVNKQKD